MGSGCAGTCMNGFLSNPLRNDCWEKKVATREKKRKENVTERAHFLHELNPKKISVLQTGDMTKKWIIEKKKTTRFRIILFIYLISNRSNNEPIYVKMKISKDLY